MTDSVVDERRKEERRRIPDRRTAKDRRLVGERRCGQRRVVDTPVAVERRSGINRRVRVLSTSSVRDHVAVHALRRLIGRLYQLAKSRHRSEKAEGRLAEARSEILKPYPCRSVLLTPRTAWRNTTTAGSGLPATPPSEPGPPEIGGRGKRTLGQPYAEGHKPAIAPAYGEVGVT